VAKMAKALGMTVVGFDPWVTPERGHDFDVELSPTLEALLPTVDIISLHLPLTCEPHHLINGKKLARMKAGEF
jgi:D-3-phosphoglycerate dehydrogenase